jgi:hypothetical protein
MRRGTGVNVGAGLGRSVRPARGDLTEWPEPSTSPQCWCSDTITSRTASVLLRSLGLRVTRALNSELSKLNVDRRCYRFESSTGSQPSAATASATILSNPDGSVARAAASSVQPSAAVSAGQRRSRASITATSTSSRCTHERLGIAYGRCCGVALVCDRGVHMQLSPSVWRFVHGLDSLAAQYSPSGVLYTYALVECACAARLGGVGGGAPLQAHRRRTPAQQTAKWP